MTIIIKIPIKKLRDKKLKLELFRRIYDLQKTFGLEQGDIKYHEHELNDSCSDRCVINTINRMGFGGT